MTSKKEKQKDIMTLVLGVLLGIFGSIVANYFDRSFLPRFGFAYEFTASVIFISILFYFYWVFRKSD